jgi:hypothetical protein
MITPDRILIHSVTINYETGALECRCTVPATSIFGGFRVDYPVILNEEVDLEGNEAWTDDDLVTAIKSKLGAIDIDKEVAIRKPPAPLLEKPE